MPRFPCPCCGHLVFDEPPGSFAICPICFWEDCPLQLEFATTLAGGPNGITLAEAQRNFAEFGACDERALGDVRRANPGESRDPAWRPIAPEVDRFEDFEAPARRHAPGPDETLYYWRPTFWRRYGS